MVALKKIKLYPVEIITLVYGIATAIYIIAGWNRVKENAAGDLLWARAAIFAGMALLVFLHQKFQRPFFPFLRQILPLAFIPYWYPETYYFNEFIFSDLDPVFIGIDQWLFGCQPSTVFSEAVPYAWFNELMNFAYFSFFFAIIGTVLYIYFRNRQQVYKATFIILCTFFLYYICFIIIPVQGPQFYVFDHDTAIPVLGPMRKFLLFLHENGEKPTGAVPSSHIGIMLTYMTLLWQYGRKLFWWILPLSILLAMSTVYIKAHYLIDVVLGFLSMPLFYYISNACWKKLIKGN